MNYIDGDGYQIAEPKPEPTAILGNGLCRECRTELTDFEKAENIDLCIDCDARLRAEARDV